MFEVQGGNLAVHAYKLGHLHHGHVLLPPDLLGVHRNEVVRIPDSVEGFRFSVGFRRQQCEPRGAGLETFYY